MRSVLDPERAKSAPGFFAAFPRFEPEPAGATLPRTRSPISGSASRAPPSAPCSPRPASRRRAWRRDSRPWSRACATSGVDIERDLLDSLGGEAAFALAPQPAEAGPAFPFLEFVAAGVDEDAARRALAALQAPLARVGRTPGRPDRRRCSESSEVDGVEARSLRISPAIELTYAVFDDLAAIATDPAGIEQLVGGDGGLDDSDRYERATEDFDDEVSLIAYLDLGELVRSASSSASPRTRSTRPLRASSAASTRSGWRSAPTTSCSPPTRACCSATTTPSVESAAPEPVPSD